MIGSVNYNLQSYKEEKKRLLERSRKGIDVFIVSPTPFRSFYSSLKSSGKLLHHPSLVIYISRFCSLGFSLARRSRLVDPCSLSHSTPLRLNSAPVPTIERAITFRSTTYPLPALPYTHSLLTLLLSLYSSLALCLSFNHFPL